MSRNQKIELTGARMKKLLLATTSILFVIIAGCQSSDNRYRPNGDAPLEPGETTFQRQRTADAPPEPGQINMEGPQTSDDIPEPGQPEMQ